MQYEQIHTLATDFSKKNGYDGVSICDQHHRHIAFLAEKQYKSDLSDLSDKIPIILVKDGVASWATDEELLEITILFERQHL